MPRGIRVIAASGASVSLFRLLFDDRAEEVLRVGRRRLGNQLQDKNQDVDPDEPFADLAAGNQGLQVTGPFLPVIVAIVNPHDNARPRRNGTEWYTSFLPQSPACVKGGGAFLSRSGGRLPEKGHVMPTHCDARPAVGARAHGV